MFSIRMRNVLVVVLAGTASALAGVEDRFPLSRHVPADVYFLSASRHNPENEFIDAYMAKVWRAFEESGISEAVWDLISENVTDEQAEEAEKMIAKCRALCSGVDWGSLFGDEVIVTGRVSFPSWETIFVLRNAKSKPQKNFEGLRAIVREIAALAPDQLVVIESDFEGAKLCALSFGKEVPVSINVGLRRDVVFMSLGDSLLKDYLRAMSSSDRPTLVKTERFRTAFAKLAPPESEISFFDPSRMMTGMHEMFRTISALEKQARRSKPAPAAAPRAKSRSDAVSEDEDDEDEDDDKGEGDDDDAIAADAPKRRAPRAAEGGRDHPDPQQVFALFHRVIDDVMIFDYVASTVHTEGYGVVTDSITALTPDAKSRPAHKIVVLPTSDEPFDRFLPVETTAFSVSELADFRALYQWIRTLFTEAVPGGTSALENWDAFLESQEFDIEKDLLDWMGNRIIFVTLGEGKFRQPQWVVLFQVRNEKLARQKVRAALRFVNRKLGEQQGLMFTDTEIAGRKFQQVAHPFMMMLQMKPIVWGTAEGYLVLGGGEDAVATCLKTAAGKHPSIRTSERFRKESRIPKGAIVSASFTDTTKFGQELQAALGGMTMGFGMFTAMTPIPDEAGGKILKAIPNILAKLVPVVGELNFYRSDSSFTTFEGDAWRTLSVTNYKDPAAVAAEDSEDNGDDEAKPRVSRTKKPAKPRAEDADDESDDDDDNGDGENGEEDDD